MKSALRSKKPAFLFSSLCLLTLAAAGFLLGTLGSAPEANAAVWATREAWSADWETRYQQWVEHTWDENIFAKPGTPTYGLKRDCADVVYTMRALFAYENGLPFAMKDATGGKKLVTNQMTRWDKLPNEADRFRQFLITIYDIGSTHSLPSDTYPVAVSRDGVRSGGLILTNKESHHSWTLKRVLPTGIPHLIYSSRAKSVQHTLLVRIDQPSMDFTFKGSLDPATHAGFRAFRSIEDLGKPVWEVAGYSDEQYKLPYGKWRSLVKQKLALVDESAQSELERLTDTACRSARERVTAVNEALDAQKKLTATPACFNAEDFDDLSTPSRDERLKDTFVEVRTLLKDHPELALKADACATAISSGRTLSLPDLMKRTLADRLSSNPNDPLASRWGEQPSSARAKRCPTY